MKWWLHMQMTCHAKPSRHENNVQQYTHSGKITHVLILAAMEIGTHVCNYVYFNSVMQTDRLTDWIKGVTTIRTYGVNRLQLRCSTCGIHEALSGAA